MPQLAGNCYSTWHTLQYLACTCWMLPTLPECDGMKHKTVSHDKKMHCHGVYSVDGVQPTAAKSARNGPSRLFTFRATAGKFRMWTSHTKRQKAKGLKISLSQSILYRASASELINAIWGISTCRWKTEQFACTMPVFPTSGTRHQADQCYNNHCGEIGLPSSPPGLLLYMTATKAAMQRLQLQHCFTSKYCNSCCHATWLILKGTQQ